MPSPGRSGLVRSVSSCNWLFIRSKVKVVAPGTNESSLRSVFPSIEYCYCSRTPPGAAANDYGQQAKYLIMRSCRLLLIGSFRSSMVKYLAHVPCPDGNASWPNAYKGTMRGSTLCSVMYSSTLRMISGVSSSVLKTRLISVLTGCRVKKVDSVGLFFALLPASASALRISILVR